MPLQRNSSCESWSNCPVEIFEHIVAHLDNASLLKLGKVDRLMNQVALRHLFERSGIHGLQKGWIFAYSPNLPREIVPALCIAFWIIDHIQDMRFYVNPDVKRLFREVRGLTRFIGRLKCLGGLTILFSSFDRWIWESPWRAHSSRFTTAIPTNLWRTLFSSLLEAALSKQCSSIQIEGAHSLHHYFVPDLAHADIPVPIIGSGALPHSISSNISEEEASEKGSEPGTSIPLWTTSTLTRWFKRGNRRGHFSGFWPAKLAPLKAKKRSSVASTQPQAERSGAVSPTSLPLVTMSHLKRLRIRSSMLLLPHFLPTTIQILRNHAQTIQELALIDIMIEEGLYIEQITELRLPALRKFSYVYEPNSTPCARAPDCILTFLLQHPSIETLQLPTFVTPLPYIISPLLPHLRSLTAHPREVAWIICDPDWHAKLETISLVSNILVPDTSSEFMPISGPDVEFQHFDEAILSVAALSRPITLEFSFRSENGLLPWITGHVNSGAQSAINQLTHVTSLNLSLTRRLRSNPGFLSHLPKWLGLFPDLRRLKLLEIPYDHDAAKSEELFSIILCSCPRLETFRVAQKQIFPA